ncbi:MAG: GNAT family N-acetyltransferase [Rhodobacteraceae bacterium]|nr:GNAT family N-acetyltransferase [Paracoccaceae bacterium]
MDREPIPARDITAPLPDWTPPPPPGRMVLSGRHARLEPLHMDHAGPLFDAFAEDATGEMWRYLGVGPYPDRDAYAAWVRSAQASADPLHFAIRMADGRLGGTLALARIQPGAGSIETGWLSFAPRMQRTPAATEAVFLLMQWAFEAGYRRFEWKCNAANLRSRRAAARFGLSFEGIFRQAAVVKGCNRDTAWFAAIDAEWPALRAAFARWLDPGNFDAEGRQRQSLRRLTAPILAAHDPAGE